MQPQEGKPEQSSSTNIPQTHLHLMSTTTGKLLEYPLITTESGSGRNAPPWLRPFFSLRVQLLFAYCLVLIMAVILVCMLTYQQTSSLYIGLVALGTVALCSLLAFFFTTILLRPLWRVTDAAQAIAVGDLKQRERLPLRLPPQDEIDRLAGSI